MPHSAAGPASTSGSLQRVRAALALRDLDHLEIREFPDRTATAAEAAAALGVPVDTIVKSLVFQADDEPILVLVGGSERVDIGKLGALLGRPIVRPNAETVRALTGFAIGGIPPLGHTTPLRTIIDRHLLSRGTVWAAAGTPNSVFGIAAERLRDACGAETADISHAT